MVICYSNNGKPLPLGSGDTNIKEAWFLPSRSSKANGMGDNIDNLRRGDRAATSLSTKVNFSAPLNHTVYSSRGHCLSCLWLWGKNFPFSNTEVAVSASHLKEEGKKKNQQGLTHPIQHTTIENFIKCQEQAIQKGIKQIFTLSDFKLLKKADTYIHKLNSMISAIIELWIWSLGNTDKKELIMLRKTEREGMI